LQFKAEWSFFGQIEEAFGPLGTLNSISESSQSQFNQERVKRALSRPIDGNSIAFPHNLDPQRPDDIFIGKGGFLIIKLTAMALSRLSDDGRDRTVGGATLQSLKKDRFRRTWAYWRRRLLILLFYLPNFRPQLNSEERLNADRKKEMGKQSSPVSLCHPPIAYSKIVQWGSGNFGISRMDSSHNL